MAVKFPIYALTLHRENVGSMGFSNEHDVASRHSLTYLKREVIGVYTRIKWGEIFFNFPNLKLDIGYQQIYIIKGISATKIFSAEKVPASQENMALQILFSQSTYCRLIWVNLIIYIFNAVSLVVAWQTN